MIISSENVFVMLYLVGRNSIVSEARPQPMPSTATSKCRCSDSLLVLWATPPSHGGPTMLVVLVFHDCSWMYRIIDHEPTVLDWYTIVGAYSMPWLFVGWTDTIDILSISYRSLVDWLWSGSWMFELLAQLAIDGHGGMLLDIGFYCLLLLQWAPDLWKINSDRNADGQSRQSANIRDKGWQLRSRHGQPPNSRLSNFYVAEPKDEGSSSNVLGGG